MSSSWKAPIRDGAAAATPSVMAVSRVVLRCRHRPRAVPLQELGPACCGSCCPCCPRCLFCLCCVRTLLMLRTLLLACIALMHTLPLLRTMLRTILLRTLPGLALRPPIGFLAGVREPERPRSSSCESTVVVNPSRRPSLCREELGRSSLDSRNPMPPHPTPLQIQEVGLWESGKMSCACALNASDMGRVRYAQRHGRALLGRLRAGSRRATRTRRGRSVFAAGRKSLGR